MRRAILVNGVPASGKSTMSAALVRRLTEHGIAAVPLAVDTIKECLFVHVGTGDRDHNRMLGRASYHGIFASIRTFPDHLVPVIDAWHGFVPVETVRDHVARARIGQVIEVWCNVSPAVAADRYRDRARTRTAGHPPASYADELYELAGRARPLGFGPVVEVNTDTPAGDGNLGEIVRLLQSGSS